VGPNPLSATPTSQLRAFNLSGRGDRSDWAAGSDDAQLAYLESGAVLAYSFADWTALAALGWNQANTAWFLHGGTVGSAGGALGGEGRTAVPEPGAWSFLLAGFSLLGVTQRRRYSSLRASHSAAGPAASTPKLSAHPIQPT
jgi:PEP-CTERM motif